MPHAYIFPSIPTLRKALKAEWRYLRRAFKAADLTNGDGPSAEPGTDLRLQCTADGWQLHSGDPSYDLSHQGAWGCGFLLYGRNNLTDLARRLINEAREQAAML